MRTNPSPSTCFIWILPRQVKSPNFRKHSAWMLSVRVSVMAGVASRVSWMCPLYGIQVSGNQPGKAALCISMPASFGAGGWWCPIGKAGNGHRCTQGNHKEKLSLFTLCNSRLMFATSRHSSFFFSLTLKLLLVLLLHPNLLAQKVVFFSRVANTTVFSVCWGGEEDTWMGVGIHHSQAKCWWHDRCLSH